MANKDLPVGLNSFDLNTLELNAPLQNTLIGPTEGGIFNENRAIVKQIQAYLYFQYQYDANLQSMVDAYNVITQDYLDWFNAINLPIYTALSGHMLDWVGQGVYGVLRPTLFVGNSSSIIGQIASVSNHGETATPNVGDGISITKTFGNISSFAVPDGIYQKILTWQFYKGDGFVFSIPWLKRRISRFLYGLSGRDVSAPWTPDISVIFTESTPKPVCTITITNAPQPASYFLGACIDNNILALPFRFSYIVDIV